MSALDLSRLERIVVGLDGSTDSHGAALFAAALARRLGLEVIGVHAMGLLEAWDDDDPSAAKHLTAARERLEAQLNGPWRQPFVEAVVDHRVELRDGNPVHVLLATATECDADLIVVGCKGAGGLAEQLMGSTSTQISERSAIPVVVVPGPHPGRGQSVVPASAGA
jgi:nucleotide-binding universal stress UspA family protein